MRLILRANSAISDLFRHGRPLAIVGRVVSVVVYSLKRQFRVWLQTHILKERFETVAPSLANADASGSIIFVVETRLTIASEFHIFPSRIFRCCCEIATSAVAVSFASLAEQLAVQAAARSRLGIDERRSAHKGFVSTIASAEPHFVAMIANRYQSAKALPCFV